MPPMTDTIWFRNGQRELAPPSYDIEQPFARWGDGFFDTQRLRFGRPIGAEHHLRRLIESATATHTVVEPGLIHSTIALACDAARALPDASLRTIVAHTRDGVDVVCALAPWTPPPGSVFTAGRIVLLSDIPHPGLGFLGKSLSYQYLKVALRGAKHAGADDALLCQQDEVIESTSASLAWSDGTHWYRADLDGRGLRSTTADALATAGWSWRARVPTRAELLDAREIALLSGLHLAVGVRSIADCADPGRLLWQSDCPDLSASAMRRTLLDEPVSTAP